MFVMLMCSFFFWALNDAGWSEFSSLTWHCKQLNREQNNTSQRGIQSPPTIQAEISTPNGSTIVQILSDSGGDISAAGPSIIRSLRDHNLLPSQVTPRTVNGQKMTPTGKLPVPIKIGNRTHKDKLHICPNIKGALMSWGTCTALSILPPSYPQPIKVQTITSP